MAAANAEGTNKLLRRKPLAQPSTPGLLVTSTPLSDPQVSQSDNFTHLVQPTFESRNLQNPFLSPEDEHLNLLHLDDDQELGKSGVLRTDSPVSPILPRDRNNYSGVMPSVIRIGQNSGNPVRSLELNDQSRYDNEQINNPHKLKMTTDMHHGQQPPEYKRRSSDPVTDVHHQSTTSTSNKTHANCQKCGKVRPTPSTALLGQNQLVGHECHSCGKAKQPLAVSHRVASNPSVNSALQNPDGVPQISRSASTPTKPTCTKCGKHKRKPLGPPPSSYRPIPQHAGPLSSHQTAADQVGLSFVRNRNAPRIRTQVQNQDRGRSLPSISIEPPSAVSDSTNKYTASMLSSPSETPVVETAQKKEFRIFRSGSLRALARSLSRSRSRSRRSKSENLLPSQKFHQSGEQNTHDLIRAISSAIRSSDFEKNQLEAPSKPPSRPETPFSFMDKAAEHDAFEMDDMRKSKMAQSKEVDGYFAVAQSEPSEEPPKAPEQPKYAFLNAPPPNTERPQITRFRSLRSGVNKATTQINRSTSLKRFGSMKKVPQLWYRDDMAFEGSTVGYVY